MKKQVFLSGIILFMLTNCMDKVDSLYEQKRNELQANVESYLTTRAVKIEVPENQIAIVRNGEDVIATLTKTSHIIVPKGETAQPQSRAVVPDSPVTVEYIDNSGGRGQGYDGNADKDIDMTKKNAHRFPFGENVNCLTQTVAFEDNINGSDYDYNDLVINATVLIPTQGGELKMVINPLALGSSYSFKLGFRYNGQDYMITPSDCRTDLFKGESGFLNTKEGSPLKKYDIIEKTFDVTAMTDQSAIDWFIEVQGTRLYAVNRFNQDWITEKLRPYGFALTHVMNKGTDTSVYIVREEDQSQAWYTVIELTRDENGTILQNGNGGNNARKIKPNSWWNWPAEKVNIEKIYRQFSQIFGDGPKDKENPIVLEQTIDATLSPSNSYTNNAIREGVINAIGSKGGPCYSKSKDYMTKNGSHMVLEEIREGLYFRDELKKYQYILEGRWSDPAGGKFDFNGWFETGKSYEVKIDGLVVLENMAWWCKNKDERSSKTTELKNKYPKGSK